MYPQNDYINSSSFNNMLFIRIVVVFIYGKYHNCQKKIYINKLIIYSNYKMSVTMESCIYGWLLNGKIIDKSFKLY